MDSKQLDLFGQPDSSSGSESALSWPDPQRFPLNQGKHQVAHAVLEDLLVGDDALVVTGYASLEQLVEFAYQCSLSIDSKSFRVVLGSEPFEGIIQSSASAMRGFSAEIRRYWLDKGISLYHSAKVVTAIEMIKSGRLLSRTAGSSHRKLHAKIYASSVAVTLGSSNFTQNGLYSQMECNTRFLPVGDKRRFSEARAIAENFWSLGEDYNTELLTLLTELLRVVSWQEALARACAELLEGQWAKDYLEQYTNIGESHLWPSQRQGIAQALWVLDNIGSVLIADPTGSGKTRMGAHLLRALGERVWRRGRTSGLSLRDLSVLVCPPAVSLSWQKEATQCGLPLLIHSHGMLSRTDSDNHEDSVAKIRRAQVLSVDEAHNFLNVTSNRAVRIMSNLADHLVLFTATPINKGPSDLIGLIELLGADNLEDDTLKVLAGLAARRKVNENTMSHSDINSLRKEIQRFTLRRTKPQLNRMVDQQPELYHDQHGKQCRYPEHVSKIYDTGETHQDCTLAHRIRELTQGLKGLALLEDCIQLSDSLRNEGWDEEKYLSGRLSAIKSLSAYNIMSSLRSSKAALVEHLLGTTVAIAELGLPADSKKSQTGNIIAKLQAKAQQPPPEIELSCPAPHWLTDPQAYQQACEEDVRIFQAILACVKSMSDARERAKSLKLMELAKTHALILAFDSHLISMEVIRQEIHRLDAQYPVFVAVGADPASRKQVMQHFARDAKGRGIALCSDSMSEGLNLQGASAIVHLDMPSVVRVAEQRVGRVDRMDSPHAVMQAWWPNDSEAFALRADERFLERYQTVDVLLGSNMPLPEEFGAVSSTKRLTIEDVIKDTTDVALEPWDGIKDAFSPVRSLVLGDKAIVPAAIYNAYRNEAAQLLSRVSLVKSRKSWAFFCMKGVNGGPPKWLLFLEGKPKPYVNLDEICLRLSVLLEGEVKNLPLDTNASQVLNRFLQQLKEAELELMPRKKKRALHQMRDMLTHYRDEARKQNKLPTAIRWEQLLGLLDTQPEGFSLDLECLAETWLGLIRPQWHTLLGRRRKRRAPLVLKDLNKDLIQQPLELDLVEKAYSDLPLIQPMDRRILSCIVGVG